VYQLGGFEDLTSDVSSINYLRDVTAVEPNGLVHMGSVHPFETDHTALTYKIGDDLHAIAILHFLPERVWGDDIRHPFPTRLQPDHYYRMVTSAEATPIDAREQAEECVESRSSKVIRGRGVGDATTVVFQVFVGVHDAKELERNLRPVNKLRDAGRLELVTNDVTDWRTYLVEHDTPEEACDFIACYNSADLKGNYTAMAAAIFFSDWHENSQANDKSEGGMLFNVVHCERKLNPGALHALFDNMQTSVTGPQTVRCWCSHNHDFVLEELLKANNRLRQLKHETARYLSLNSGEGDLWLAEQRLSQTAKGWLRATETVHSLLLMRTQRESQGETHTPTVIENVPRSLTSSDIIRVLTHFAGGSNDYTDTARWGTSRKGRPLIVIAKLPIEQAKKNALGLTLPDGQVREFVCVPFDAALHNSGNNLLGLDDDKSESSGSTELSRKRFNEEPRAKPPSKFAKGISQALAQKKNRQNHSGEDDAATPLNQRSSRSVAGKSDRAKSVNSTHQLQEHEGKHDTAGGGSTVDAESKHNDQDASSGNNSLYSYSNPYEALLEEGEIHDSDTSVAGEGDQSRTQEVMVLRPASILKKTKSKATSTAKNGKKSGNRPRFSSVLSTDEHDSSASEEVSPNLICNRCKLRYNTSLKHCSKCDNPTCSQCWSATTKGTCAKCIPSGKDGKKAKNSKKHTHKKNKRKPPSPTPSAEHVNPGGSQRGSDKVVESDRGKRASSRANKSKVNRKRDYETESDQDSTAVADEMESSSDVDSVGN